MARSAFRGMYVANNSGPRPSPHNPSYLLSFLNADVCTSSVTKQPCQVELVRLLDMVNPTTGSDWPPSPRTDDYCRELQSQDTSILDAFRATVSNILRDCLVKEWLQAMNMCRPRTSVESIKPAPKQQQALWSNLQRFFGEEEGRKVKFNSVPQV